MVWSAMALPCRLAAHHFPTGRTGVNFFLQNPELIFCFYKNRMVSVAIAHAASRKRSRWSMVGMVAAINGADAAWAGRRALAGRPQAGALAGAGRRWRTRRRPRSAQRVILTPGDAPDVTSGSLVPRGDR